MRHTRPGSLPSAWCRRAWDALRTTSRARCLVLFHRGRCLMQLGVAPAGQAPGAAAPGPICQQAMKSGTGNYLANLVLFPGGGAEGAMLPGRIGNYTLAPQKAQGSLMLGNSGVGGGPWGKPSCSCA